jgi:hypothetical protein
LYRRHGRGAEAAPEKEEAMFRTIRMLILAALLTVGVAALASAATVRGSIAKLDPAAKTLSVNDGKQEVPLSLAKDAKILNGSKAMTLSGLKVGDRVQVQYTDQDGKHLASRVEMAGAAAAVAHPAAKPSAKTY